MLSVMQGSPIIFDRQAVRRHRDRAAAVPHDYFLFREMAERLCERLPDFTRQFPMALDIGAHAGILAAALQDRGGIRTLVQTDMSPAMVAQAEGLRVAADEEFLPFAENTFDLVLSAGSLHWVNDLPGALIQIRHALKSDGLFMAMLPGGETLKELRACLEQAEMRVSGGVSPRISPFIDVRDAGALLQRTGFSMPVADSETLTVSYENPLALLEDLRGMGETNALVGRRRALTPQALLFEAMAHYEDRFAGENGLVPATFELVTMTGWKTS